MIKQPEALRLADALLQKERRVDVYVLNDASTELRRLHALVGEWERKAATWLASPEAAQRLEGYRELAAQCAALEAEVVALRSILTNVAKHAEWREKYIYYINDNGEVEEPCQNWLLYVYLRVPVNDPDKSVEKALEREINSRMEAK